MPPSGKHTSTKLKSVIWMLWGLLHRGTPKKLENLQELKPSDQCLIGQTKENRRTNIKIYFPMLLQEWLLEMKVDISTPASLRYQWEKKSLFILPTKGLSLQLLAISRKWFGNKIPVTAMMTQEGENIKCQHYWPNILGQKKTMVSDRLRLALVTMQQLKGFSKGNDPWRYSDVVWQEVWHFSSEFHCLARPQSTITSATELAFISWMRHIPRLGPIITHCALALDV